MHTKSLGIIHYLRAEVLADANISDNILIRKHLFIVEKSIITDP